MAKKKKAKRAAATRKAVTKRKPCKAKKVVKHRKKSVPDLVAGKFCIATDTAFVTLEKAFALSLEGGHPLVFDDKTSATTALAAMKNDQVLGIGGDELINTASVLPLKKHFATRYQWEPITHDLSAQFVDSRDAVTLKAATAMRRKYYVHGVKDLKRELKKAEKDVKTFEKVAARYV